MSWGLRSFLGWWGGKQIKISSSSAIEKKIVFSRRNALLDKLPYSYYAYGIYHAADLARRLKIPRISVVEFGVAGGNGLVAMEAHAQAVEVLLGVKIDVYGFDTGEGLTPPKDYRDMPYRFATGNYKMDVPALKKRLKSAQLILGDVKETTPEFLKTYRPAPIGFVSFDMDYYSATMSAFSIFAEHQSDEFFLPRLQLYFDDITGNEISSYNEFVGELAAINDFNRENRLVKIAESRALRKQKKNLEWYHQIYVMHRFQHPMYATYISGAKANSLSLRSS